MAKTATTGKSKTKAESNGDRRHKNFGDAMRVDDLEPLSFDLCGQTFHCRPAIQSKRLLYFVAQADSDSGAQAGNALHKFLEEVILEDDRAAWKELVDGDEYIIDAQLLGDIVTFLVEAYSGRPTTR